MASLYNLNTLAIVAFALAFLVQVSLGKSSLFLGVVKKYIYAKHQKLRLINSRIGLKLMNALVGVASIEMPLIS
uniref:PAR-1c protein n=1 Tax=Solanum tuberosum TaxID=4113 RepID=M1B514_SOLTU